LSESGQTPKCDLDLQQTLLGAWPYSVQTWVTDAQLMGALTSQLSRPFNY